jgi:hypothetical protein
MKSTAYARHSHRNANAVAHPVPQSRTPAPLVLDTVALPFVPGLTDAGGSYRRPVPHPGVTPAPVGHNFVLGRQPSPWTPFSLGGHLLSTSPPLVLGPPLLPLAPRRSRLPRPCPSWSLNHTISTYSIQAVAWAGPSQGQALNDGFGPACHPRKPKPPQAKPGRHEFGALQVSCPGLILLRVRIRKTLV